MAKRKRKTLSQGQVSLTGEADYIIGKAQERDARVVTLGSIVLFSTCAGDAWMLDPEGALALCLARDGVKQDYMILEAESSFQIGWNTHYEIHDDAFTVATADGRVLTIIGYPTEEIVRASRSEK